MRLGIILFLLGLSVLSCESMLSDGESSAGTVKVLNSHSTLVAVNGQIQMIRGSFFFFSPNGRQGYFLYPEVELMPIQTHFNIRLNSGDTIVCGVVQKGTRRKLTVQADISADYHGDVSKIIDFCSGKGSYLYTNDGKTTSGMNPSSILDKSILGKTSRFVFPYIPYFVSSLNDIASPGNNKMKVILKIEFFDRLSKSTITDCTYYKVDGNQQKDCYGVPIIYPEVAFYGSKYRSRQLHPVKALAEYLENTTGA